VQRAVLLLQHTTKLEYAAGMVDSLHEIRPFPIYSVVEVGDDASRTEQSITERTLQIFFCFYLNVLAIINNTVS
jgi:hypothetical protein